MIKLIAITYGILLAIVFFAQRRFLYHPYREAEEVLVKLGKVRGMEPWRSPSGQLIGWKNLSTNAVKNRLLIIHGNAGCALDRCDHGQSLNQVAPFDVYILEYPGYGARSGSPSQASLFAAADEALALLKPQGKTFLLGESLGTGVAAYLAGTYPEAIAGVLLITPYYAMTSVAQFHMPIIPVAWLLLDRYPSARYLRNFNGPVAVVLAGQDEVIPKKFGRRLFDEYSGPKQVWEIPESGHNEAGRRPVQWWRELQEFWTH